jgi:sugar fermentation stimulation protein A
MRYPAPLIPARLVRRYKRFLADAMLSDGSMVVAHCANPGSMLGLAAPGSEIWLSAASAPRRRLAYGWEIVRADGVLVGINTLRANPIVAEAIAAGAIPALRGYDRLRREVACGDSRIDFLLAGEGRPDCYVEVKSVTLRRGGPAEFPDSVTRRGHRHLGALAAVAARGERAVLLFLVQRGDCDALALASDIDPAYAAAFLEARAMGVETICHACEVQPESITVARPLPIVG